MSNSASNYEWIIKNIRPSVPNDVSDIDDIRRSILPPRIGNALWNGGILTLGHLKTVHEISGINALYIFRGIGDKSILLIKRQIGQGLLEDIEAHKPEFDINNE